MTKAKANAIKSNWLSGRACSSDNPDNLRVIGLVAGPSSDPNLQPIILPIDHNYPKVKIIIRIPKFARYLAVTKLSDAFGDLCGRKFSRFLGSIIKFRVEEAVPTWSSGSKCM